MFYSFMIEEVNEEMTKNERMIKLRNKQMELRKIELELKILRER